MLTPPPVPPGGHPPGHESVGWFQRIRALPRAVLGAIGVLVFLLVWYGVVGTIQAVIAPDPALRPSPAQLPPGGSVAVGFAARLIDVEVNERSFTPNNPFFFPTGLTRRTPAYQGRIIATTAAVVDALADGSQNPSLLEAAARLETPADQWWLHAGWPPVRTSAERDYRRALAALEASNASRAARAQKAPATAPRLDPATLAALAALADALEAEAARGDLLIRGRGDENPAVHMAAARGTAHAAAMLLRGLRDDDAVAVRGSGRAARWSTAIDALDALAGQSPVIVREADLVRAGYHLLMAGAALREIGA